MLVLLFYCCLLSAYVLAAPRKTLWHPGVTWWHLSKTFEHDLVFYEKYYTEILVWLIVTSVLLTAVMATEKKILKVIQWKWNYYLIIHTVDHWFLLKHISDGEEKFQTWETEYWYVLLIEKFSATVHKAIHWEGIVRGGFLPSGVFLTTFWHACGMLTLNCGCTNKIIAWKITRCYR